MKMITGVDFSASHKAGTIFDVKESGKLGAEGCGDKSDNGPLKPVMDEYVPEEKQEKSGRYWLGKDEEGAPKIYQDALDENASKENSAKRTEKTPEKKTSGSKEEKCTASTDKVDREIEKLKRKKEELEQKISSETDETKIKELEKKLMQVENELKQKDNDTYRRQHTVFS